MFNFLISWLSNTLSHFLFSQLVQQTRKHSRNVIISVLLKDSKYQGWDQSKSYMKHSKYPHSKAEENY